MIYTTKVLTAPPQVGYFVLGLPGASQVAGFWIFGVNWKATILKDTQGALRPRAFIGMSNGSSLPAMPFPYNAVAVGSAIDALGVPTVLVELTPTTFALGSALTQTEADDMSASLGFTIPAKFWNSSNWLASP